MKISGIDATTDVLRQVLTRSARRAEVTASNIANVDTPGYRAVDLFFPPIEPEQADTGLEITRPGHIATRADTQGTVFEADVTRVRADGNTVDIDREMTLLARTQGRYRTAAELIRKRFALLIYAATDGRGGA